ncbi:MAG: exonuclease domain-containing protein [Alphaproteobacteria bacterium]|nr:exonuclease domain-containing protein [Alphaproteobacteria bacterium]
MQIVIFDTEYTTWEGTQKRCWTGPGEYKEIIQIGAIKVSWPDGEIVDRILLLIKPQVNPVLSDYFISLTGISQKIVDEEGIKFSDALVRFLDFCGDIPVVSYGNDSGILAENILLTKSHPYNFYGKKSPSFINIKYWILSADPEAVKVNSGKLWEYFGLSMHEKFSQEHSPISDCYSILQALLHLKKNNFRLPF